MHKLFLILLTLALAVAPLRGAWAAADISPATSGNDNASHCEQMQHGNPADADRHEQHADNTPTATNDEPCSHDCGGNCCDGACNACVHATSAISANPGLLSGTSTGTLNTTLSQLFPERPAIPLLHPPASIHS